MKNIFRYILLSFVAFYINSCSTEKNTATTRGYHNMTAHYNVYFNGYESYKKGELSGQESIEDDFANILPIFLYSDKAVSQRVMSDMDKAIKKATKAVTVHSITAKPEFKKGEITEKEKEYYERNEFVKWIDDGYMLMGQSYLYRQEYINAMDAFRHIINKYPYEETVYDAKIWLARSHSEKREYNDCEQILTTLEEDEEFPERLEVDLNLTYADLFIKKEEYSSAISYLEKALEKKKNNKKYYRIRYTYILAQLNQEVGNLNKAYELYGEVIKMDPPYTMTFNAKINMAGVFQSSIGSSREIKIQLYKMLKDEKNKEYQDQIYYALGNIAFKEENLDEAILNYQKSVQVSVSNYNQKALSYLTLADIYYDMSNYPVAQLYYDSTVVLIDDDYPNFSVIYAKANTLNQLVSYINTVTLQDSLLKLSLMKEDQRLAIIDGIINELKQQEYEEKMLEQERRQEQQYNRQTINESRSFTNTATSSAGGKWYFYNPAIKGFGQAEFKMKWGTRKLEDNWRRKNKKSTMGDDELGEDEEENSEDLKKGMDKRTREYYLIDIPLTDSAKAKSHLKIQKALYKKGTLYRNDLKETELALESFNELARLYPESDYTLASYYNLYQIYKTEGNKTKELFYKNKIINNYPDSHYAKLLTDPDYISKLQQKEKEVLNLYMGILRKYNNKMYSQVINETDRAIKKYPKHELLPKFVYLNALAVGESTDDDVLLKKLLVDLTERFPSDDVSEVAQKTIELLNQTSVDVIEEIEIQEEIAAKEIYYFNSDTTHYIGFILEKKSNVDQLVFNIINYNLDFYPNSTFVASGENLNDDAKIVIIKSFKNAAEANEYMNKIVAYEEIFKDVNKKKTKPLIITPANLTTLQSDKILSKFWKFHNAFYK